jgi:hypothetical protein
LGTHGLALATVQGGQLPDNYPLPPNYYMEGILRGRWDIHKVKHTELTDFSQVEKFVSCVTLTFFFSSWALSLFLS